MRRTSADHPVEELRDAKDRRSFSLDHHDRDTMATDDGIEAAPPSDHVTGKEARGMRTLGQVRLRNEHTREIILVPTPSSDPNDPLNW
jgi:hypothetical protein